MLHKNAKQKKLAIDNFKMYILLEMISKHIQRREPHYGELLSIYRY